MAEYLNIPSKGSGGTAAGGRKISSRSPGGLDLRPEPIDETLDFLITRADRVQPVHRGGVRIDTFVVKHGFINKFLTGQIAVRVGDQIAVFRRDLGPQQIIDEIVRLSDVLCIFRYGEIVEKHLRAFL